MNDDQREIKKYCGYILGSIITTVNNRLDNI